VPRTRDGVGPGTREAPIDEEPTHEDATSRVWYLRTAASSDGEVHEQRVEYRPGSPFPPTHLHPEQSEHFEVEHGRMLFVVGREHLVGAGETLDIPRWTPHRARNASSSEPAIVRWSAAGGSPTHGEPGGARVPRIQAGQRSMAGYRRSPLNRAWSGV
jgi:mannose-6-phosphate isomerase-like protein (cupin superfamily)